MKKLAIVVILLLLVAAGMAGGYYYLGNTIEKEYFNALAEHGHWGPFTLTNKSYEHGLISSKVQTVVEIADTAELSENEGNQTAENTKIILEHTIWHGPVALSNIGGNGLKPVPSLAVIETRVVGCAPMPEELKSIAAEIPELAKSNMVVTIGLDGHVQGDVKIPAFSKEKDGAKVNWGGFALSVNASRDKRKLLGSLEMPKTDVHVTAGEPGDFSVGAIKGTFDLTEDLPSLYLGSSKLSLDSVDGKFTDAMGVAQQFSMKDLSIDANSGKTGNMLNIVENINLASLTAENATYGPAACTLELKNIDAQAMSDFQVQLRKIYSDFGADPQQMEGQVNQMLAMYKELFLRCLKSNPEMNITKLHLSSSRGNADGRFLFKFVAPAEINLDNPLPLLKNIESSADLSIQEKLVKSFLMDEVKRELEMYGSVANDGENVQKGVSDEDLQKMADEQFEAQVAPLVEQKYLLREGDMLKSSATFKDGKLLVNGQEIPLF